MEDVVNLLIERVIYFGPELGEREKKHHSGAKRSFPTVENVSGATVKSQNRSWATIITLIIISLRQISLFCETPRIVVIIRTMACRI